MPGVAQLWLTEDELDAVLTVMKANWFNFDVDFDSFDAAYDKLRAAHQGVACPVPAKEDA